MARLAINFPHYFYYFRATGMALLCLARLIDRRYLADRVCSWILPCGLGH